ncbi:hypothetical protein WA1_06900 [Scytonema hofmannii PCC 7110]|uniref:Outer membrane protein beta-barrel domain-containing protein n=1 Tax=Scytonema hofmannii PCC 7110 TaxID=128403 RepID=A0A139WSX3_9CYAN|nr:hypothetical protein [Scytonema hofmannii]KYC35545.1 hypothetical protein WA1_06900 [Scytonema hofmannii PCC 7110]
MKTTFWKYFPLIASSLAIVTSSLPARAQKQNITSDREARSVNHVTSNMSKQVNSASALISPPETSQAAPLPRVSQPESSSTSTSKTRVAQVISPGRATRSGPSYIGVAGNIGLTGDTGIGEGAFTLISKLGLSRNFSVRPGVIFGDDPVFLVPLTVDFPQENLEITQVNVAPYIGGGVAISTGRDSTVGALITGGVDVPLSPQITATAGVNVGFIDDTDVGLLVGVGYNF